MMHGVNYGATEGDRLPFFCCKSRRNEHRLQLLMVILICTGSGHGCAESSGTDRDVKARHFHDTSAVYHMHVSRSRARAAVEGGSHRQTGKRACAQGEVARPRVLRLHGGSDDAERVCAPTQQAGVVQQVGRKENDAEVAKQAMGNG